MPGHVLLVHDDIATIASARRVLVAEGLEVTLATSSADAIIAFGQRPPALIVLAPGVDGGRGHSVYDEIRAFPKGEHIRFILLGQPIADAHDTVQVELPLQPDAFRAAVRRALAVEGSGWELQESSATHEEPAGTPHEADPWRVADPRPTLGEEPLAEALFGDLTAESEGSRPSSAAVPIVAEAPLPPPSVETSGPEAEAVPPELAQLPLEDEGVHRPVTDIDDQPTLDRAFEELELPPEELERAAAARSREAQEARERAEAGNRARADAVARRDALRAQLEQARAQKLTFDADAEHAESRRAALEAETLQLESQLEAQRAQSSEVIERLHQATSEVEKLEKGLATLAGMLAAEQQAREGAERQLASIAQRHEALSVQHADAEAQLQAEAAERKALEQQRDEAEARARSEQEAGAAASEAAREHAQRIRELEQQLRAAEAEAAQRAAARAGAVQELATLENELLDLERGLKQAQQQIEAEQAQLSGLEAKKAELESERAAREEACAEAEQNAKAMQAQRASLQTAVQQATQKLQVESDRLATLERAREAADIKLTQAARAEEKARAELDSLRQRKADVQQAADTLRSELAKADQARATTEQARDAASREVEKLQRQVQKLQEELAAREQAVAESQQARSEGESRALELLQQLEDLEARRNAADGEREKAAASRDEASVELQQLQSELQRVGQELSELESTREALTSEIQAARRAIAQADEERRGLHARRAQADQDRAKAVETRNAALQELQSAQAALAEELAQLEKQSVESQQQLLELEQRQAELESKLVESRAARDAAQARAGALAARREEFQKAVAAAESEVAASPRAEIPPERIETRPLRPAKRPFVGGRFKRPEARTLPGAPVDVEPSLAPAFPEGPLEPRAPGFGEKGELGQLGAAAFFARVWQERVTGRFDVTLRDGVRALFFEEGRLVAALSSVPYDRLESLAQREGLITRAHERVLRTEHPDLAPRQMAVRMVELQLLKGTELYGLVRRHMEQVAYALFAEQAGTFEFLAEVAPPEHRVALPVHPLAFMLEGVRRKGDFDRLSAALGGPSALVRRCEGSPDLNDFGFSARERRFVSLVDGLRTVEELIFASGLEPPAAMKLLSALSAARVVDVLPGEPPEASAEPELQIDLARVGEKYEQARNGDYFEILGVDRDATSYEVRAAFERLTREFHPARFAGVDDPGLASRLEEIGRMVAEAADVLSDDHTRRAYAQHLAQAG